MQKINLKDTYFIEGLQCLYNATNFNCNILRRFTEVVQHRPICISDENVFTFYL